jgi:dolichyl-phosphate-mannose-protein mannosyltransferase
MTAETPDCVDQSSPPPWIRYDSLAIGALIIVAAIQHFWRLQLPGILVYDEHVYVEEAYKYLGGRVFFEVHPPLAITLIVASAWLFGCHSWSWRISSALAGTALIPITYLLARRMFKSRRAATLSAGLVLCEGMFMEYSRLALINIIYLTLAAAAYLAVFRFMQVRDVRDRRRTLTLMGIALGLGLGSKLAIPGITWLLTVGFMIGALLTISGQRKSIADWWAALDLRYLTGALILVGSVSALFFVLTFLPNYLVGWWGGVASITSYYHHVMIVNRSYPAPVSHQDSPWWSWPLMLRAYNYSQQQDDVGNYLTVWGGGNPAIWWAALVAMVLAAIRALRRDGLAWRFLILGYLMYTAMWIPVPRALYLYSYLPAFYLGILALAGLLACCWDGTAAIWEQVSLMLPVIAVALFGLGFVYGAIASSVVAAGYVALLLRSNLRGWSGRFVCVVFVAVAAAVFIYFLPLWIPLALSESQLQARMWFNSAGIGDWM